MIVTTRFTRTLSHSLMPADVAGRLSHFLHIFLENYHQLTLQNLYQQKDHDGKKNICNFSVQILVNKITHRLLSKRVDNVVIFGLKGGISCELVVKILYIRHHGM